MQQAAHAAAAVAAPLQRPGRSLAAKPPTAHHLAKQKWQGELARARWLRMHTDRHPGYYKLMGRNECAYEIDYVFDES